MEARRGHGGEEGGEEALTIADFSGCGGVWRGMRAGPQSWVVHLQIKILNNDGEMERGKRGVEKQIA